LGDAVFIPVFSGTAFEYDADFGQYCFYPCFFVMETKHPADQKNLDKNSII